MTTLFLGLSENDRISRIQIRRLVCVLLAPILAVSCFGQNNAAQNDLSPIVSALKAREFEKALTLSQSALNLHPDDYRIWTLRGMATAGTGNLPLALAAYERALRLAPSYLPALEGAAQTEFQLRRPATRSLLEKVLAQSPDDQATHALLAVLDYRAANCSDAVDHFSKASAIIATQPEALIGYGSCLGSLRRNEDAVKAFAQVLSLDPEKHEARYNLALAQWNAQHADDALKTLQPLIEMTPVDADTLALSADILESEGDTAGAVALLRKALQADPKNAGAYLQFARLSYVHSSAQVGIDILNLGLTQLPKDARLYLVRGILLTQLGEFTRAADDFESATRIDSRIQFLAVAEGIVQSQQHHPADALAKYRAAVKAHPNEAYGYYVLAEALSEKGSRPGTPEYKEELDSATRAVKLDPSLVAAHDLRCSIYLEGGQLDLAIKESQAALVIDTDDQEAVYHLIVALRNKGDKSQIPELLKHLMEIKANAAAVQKDAKQFRLYEATDSTGSPTQ